MRIYNCVINLYQMYILVDFIYHMKKIENLISNVKDNLSEIGKETNVNEKLIAKTNDKLTELNSDINEIFSVNKNLFDNLNIKDIYFYF